MNIPDIIREMERLDEEGNTNISKYVTHNMRETINTIDAYLNSKHISGEVDSMGREKPFFNIVTSASNIWYRATDIDRKNIKIKADKRASCVPAFVATLLLQEYMKKEEIGTFLNNWGRILARYGSAITKIVEQGDKLVTRVMPWSIMIVDPTDFYNNPVIEKLWFTPAQLRANKDYDQDMVDDLIENLQKKETVDGKTQDSKAGYIELYEIHGEFPQSYLTDKESDDDIYVQQMHVISYIAKKEGRNGKYTYDDYTLYRGREAKNPYDISHLIEEDGRTLAIGAVEHLFQSQWMVNHSAKSIKDQLDLASKLIFQTSDGNFVGQNALGAIESGDILIHKVNEPLTQIANNSSDITSLQNFGQQWKTLGNEIVGISEAMLGANPPSGSAWRQTQAMLQESHSLFEVMRENKGLAIERMLRNHIIPHLKRKMDTTDELSVILDEHQVKKLDSLYVPNKAIKQTNDEFAEKVLNDEQIQEGEMEMARQQSETDIQKGLNQFGNQRFIKPSEIDSKTWKESLKDLEWDLDIDVTGESEDTNSVLTTLNTTLQTIAGLNGQPMPPEMKVVFNKILEKTGALSPLELEATPEEPQQPLQQEINKPTPITTGDKQQ